MKKDRTLFQRLFCQGLLGEIREKEQETEDLLVRCAKAERIMRQESEAKQDAELKVGTLESQVRKLKEKREKLILDIEKESKEKEFTERRLTEIKGWLEDYKADNRRLNGNITMLEAHIFKKEKRVSELEKEIKARKELHKNDLAKAKEDAQAPTKALDDMWKFISSTGLENEFQKSLTQENEDETTSN